MGYAEEYRKKLVTPEEAVKVVKSGDWIEYGFGHTKPIALDKALAARKDELKDINIRHTLTLTPQACIEADPEGEYSRCKTGIFRVTSASFMTAAGRTTTP